MNETLAIYGRRFWRLTALVAIVQVPVTLVLLPLGGGVAGYVLGLALSALASTIVYAMVACAVGQHYVFGDVQMRRCYAPLWGRIVSLVVLTALLALVMAPLFGPILVASDDVVIGLLGVVFVPVLLVLFTCWTVSVQAVVVERHKALGALRRTFSLMSGSWWRVIGVTIVIALVAVGLGIVVILPLSLVLGMVVPLSGSAISDLVVSIAVVAVLVAVSPVVWVGGTLVYYDLRVRKEQFSVDTLSREMGILSIGPPPRLGAFGSR